MPGEPVAEQSSTPVAQWRSIYLVLPTAGSRAAGAARRRICPMRRLRRALRGDIGIHSRSDATLLRTESNRPPRDPLGFTSMNRPPESDRLYGLPAGIALRRAIACPRSRRPGKGPDLDADGMQGTYCFSNEVLTGQSWNGAEARGRSMVPRRGLEPPRCYPLVPETSASTNSATWAGSRSSSRASGPRERRNVRTASGAVN